MAKAAMLAVIALTLATSAYAQPSRVFVSGNGLDTNPCTVTQPCRTFQQAHNVAAANGEIDVLDPAGYGSLTITKGISIQAHGFGGITQADPNANAITIAVTTSDPVMLNGLLIDGGGSGEFGVRINSGQSVTILNSVVRHFQVGIGNYTSTAGSNLLVEDTVASDNQLYGIEVFLNGLTVNTMLSRITAKNNQYGVGIGPGATTWLAKSVISGNTTGVQVDVGTMYSYGDNYIRDNSTPLTGFFTPVTTQ
jgi:hypothetical protein